MARDWEDQFKRWSKPSSDTEQTKMDNAERMIRDAISESEALQKRTIEVFAQGSYKNNTNIRIDSDVDICVLCTDSFFYDFDNAAPGLNRATAGFDDASYAYADFRKDVELALVNKFGEKGITRGKKAFDVHANSYRVDADVVAAFEHRRYTKLDIYGRPEHLSGIQFTPDGGGKVVNWPRQHYASGVQKTEATGRRFKFMTRILKNIQREMEEKGVSAAVGVASFLMECLVSNVPNDRFGHDTYTADVRAVLAYTFNGTLKQETCNEWVEVSGLKWLFRPTQPWTREQALTFLGAAWTHVGFD